MNRKVIALLFVATMVMSLAAIGTAAAKTTTQNILFNFNDGECTFSQDCVSAVLTGNIKDADGILYLGPLSGTITVDDEDHPIKVKLPKQSESLFYFEEEIVEPEGKVKFQQWYTPVKVNINGYKFVGELMWDKFEDSNGVVLDEGSSLFFTGIVDGNHVRCKLEGDFPVLS